MSAWPRYPAYKDSGVEWLGEVPGHWNWAKIIRHASLRTGGTPDRNNPLYWVDGTINWLASGEVNKRIIWEVDGKITEAGIRNSNASMLPENSVLIALNGQGRTKGMSALLKVPSTCNQSLAAFICNEEVLLPSYLHFYLESRYRDIRGLVGEQRDGLSLGLLKQIPIYLPPLPEQQAIAAFLNRKTAEIDGLIAKKEQLIALLREKRAAVITQAVTKGLDAAAALKDSGVAWLGEVPRHWEVKRLRRLMIRVQRPVSVRPDAEYQEIGIRSWGKGVFHKDPLRGALLEEKSVFYVEPGDLVLNIVFAWEGAVAVVSEAESGMIASHRFPTFRHTEEVDLDYLLLFLQSEQGRAFMAINSPGAAGRNKTIRLGQFLSEQVPIPPLDEQRKIVRAFRTFEGQLEALIEETRNAMERLKEYRTALISAAVTGKVDVRGA